MPVKKLFFLLLIFIVIEIIRPLYAEMADFKKIADDYISVNTIKASITQTIHPEDGSSEVFTGNYFAVSRGFIRIDYIRPESQTVVVNDTGLFWYYSNRNLLFVSEKNGTGREAIPALMNVVPQAGMKDINVTYEGRKFYSFFKLAEVYSITSEKNKNVMILWIDPVVKIVKRKYILDDQGREMIREDYADHTLVNGKYIPSRIEFKARTASGIIHTVTEYSNIVINSQMDKDIFKFKIMPEMKVRVLREK